MRDKGQVQLSIAAVRAASCARSCCPRPSASRCWRCAATPTTRSSPAARAAASSPPGLYVTVSGAQRDDELSSIIAQPPSYFGYVQAGISKMWLPYGNTTIYGDFGLYRNFNVGELLSADLQTNKLEVWGTLAQTEVRRRGFGIEQSFDKIGLLVYAQAHYYDAKISGYPCNSSFLPKICGVDLNQLTTLPILPWDGVVVGARLRF
jgi:hypothetical protein